MSWNFEPITKTGPEKDQVIFSESLTVQFEWPVSKLASDSCSGLTQVEPNEVLCCCSKSSSMINALRMLWCFSAHYIHDYTLHSQDVAKAPRQLTFIFFYITEQLVVKSLAQGPSRSSSSRFAVLGYKLVTFWSVV